MITIGLLFWLIMIFWLVFGGYQNRADFPGWANNNWMLFVLLFLLGWSVFGWPIGGR